MSTKGKTVPAGPLNVMVLVAVRDPDELVVNPTVYVAGAPAVAGDGEAVTEVTSLAEATEVNAVNEAPRAMIAPKAILGIQRLRTASLLLETSSESRL